MTITVTTHLNFRGDARAALEFYQVVFGGDLAAISYSDAHSVQNPAEADQIMWGQVAAPNGFHVMAYDVPSAMPYDAGTNAHFVSVRGRDGEEISSHWKALSDGAHVVVDLGPAAWAPLYGMLVDKFGVTWVLDVAADHPTG